jgi:hypothetical protein
MRIELRVDRNGQTIFRAECDTQRGGSFAEFSKLALREFNQRHPEVSLLDDDVWLKFDTVRCPEAPKAPDGQAHPRPPQAQRAVACAVAKLCLCSHTMTTVLPA